MMMLFDGVDGEVRRSKSLFGHLMGLTLALFDKIVAWEEYTSKLVVWETFTIYYITVQL